MLPPYALTQSSALLHLSEGHKTWVPLLPSSASTVPIPLRHPN